MSRDIKPRSKTPGFFLCPAGKEIAIMDYESFKADLTSALEDLGYSRENIAFSETQKNNGVTNRTITVRNDLPIAPNINLEGFIEDVANGKDISEIADRIDELIKSQPDFSQTDFRLTWDRVKDNVVFVLVNGETNKDLLDSIILIKTLK